MFLGLDSLRPILLYLTSCLQKAAAKRALNNENDENVATTRLTRAKAAARGAAEPDMLKRGLARSKSTTSAVATGNLARKRAALGDVSNLAKNDVGAANDAKKPLAAKTGLASKAAQPTKVQKHGRSQSSKSILPPKSKTAQQSDLKRPHPGGQGPASKKRGSSSAKINVAEDAENIAPVEASLQRTNEKAAPAQSLTPKDPEPEIDDEDLRDPTMVAEYSTEIFKYMKSIEPLTMPNHTYMEQQDNIDWRMRGILVDWLIEVHARFKLLPETLFLTVNILDRFLSRKLVQVDKLQLVGVSAMFLAAKYEEVISPHVSSFRHVSDDGFTDEEILNAERYLLLNIDYDLSYPNPLNFLRRISKPDGYDVEARTLGKYLLELSIVDHRFMRFPGSQIAATAMYLSRLILDRGEWVRAPPAPLNFLPHTPACSYESC
jgi:G2/mitotic-specific cyclin 1/2